MKIVGIGPGVYIGWWGVVLPSSTYGKKRLTRAYKCKLHVTTLRKNVLKYNNIVKSVSPVNGENTLTNYTSTDLMSYIYIYKYISFLTMVKRKEYILLEIHDIIKTQEY